MTFRTATYDDAATLLRWRHIDEHQPWYHGSDTDVTEHVKWLSLRLRSPLVHILIWHENNQDIGTVRIDSNGELAFHCDDDDACIRMLKAARHYASIHGGRLKAAVDPDNTRARRMLHAAGYTHQPIAFHTYTCD